MTKKISSKDNPTFKSFKSLHTSKGIKEEKSFLLTGEKLIQEFLQHPNHEIVAELMPSGARPISGSLNTLEFPEQLFNDLDEIGTHYNILVLKLPEIPLWNPDSEPQGLEVFLPLGDPNNLGSAIRSCEAFQVKQLILTEEASHPFHPKSIKASAGSALRMKYQKAPKLQNLPKDFYALDMFGIELSKFKWPENIRLVLGEEGPGIGNYQTKNKIKIDMQSVESLNATVALSIALYSRLTRN